MPSRLPVLALLLLLGATAASGDRVVGVQAEGEVVWLLHPSIGAMGLLAGDLALTGAGNDGPTPAYVAVGGFYTLTPLFRAPIDKWRVEAGLLLGHSGLEDADAFVIDVPLTVDFAIGNVSFRNRLTPGNRVAYDAQPAYRFTLRERFELFYHILPVLHVVLGDEIRFGPRGEGASFAYTGDNFVFGAEYRFVRPARLELSLRAAYFLEYAVGDDDDTSRTAQGLRFDVRYRFTTHGGGQ